MKSTITQSKLALLLALVTSLWVTGFAGNQVPISGKFKGTVQATVLSDPAGTVRLVATGTGSVSHLGKATAEVVFPAAIIDVAAGELVLLEHQWRGTITTANGDQIFGEYTLDSDTLPISPLGQVVYSAALHVTGGTGRFENATGEAVATGSGNLADLSFVVELKGVIGTIGSSQ